MSLQELNKCLQNFYLSARKRDGQSRYFIARAKIVIVSTVNELKIIIFVLDYPAVLVYTKTSFRLSVGGYWWILTSPPRVSINYHD